MTETALRAMHLENGAHVTVKEDSFVTDSARKYAAERGILLSDTSVPSDGDSKWERMTREAIDTAAKFPFVDDITGEPYEKKPEDMTHIRGNRLVKKTDKRIAFRGKIDNLESEILILLYECDRYGKTEALGKLSEILELSKMILAAEVKDEELPTFRIFGMDEKELRSASHNVMKSMGVEHPIPDYHMGILCMKLNRLRTLVRETELFAVNAFPDGERNDIVLALNRMSSAVYLIFLEEMKNHG